MIRSRPLRRTRTARHGMTLVELLMALLLLSVLSTAVTSLLVGAADVNRYVGAQAGAIWDADFAAHRILANGQAAVLSSPPAVATDANGQSRLTLTVPDVANNTTRTVVYYCTGTAAPFSLVESDPRYNGGGQPCVIASNVTGFTVTRTTSPTTKLQVTLTLGPTNSWQVRRHFYADCRGL